MSTNGFDVASELKAQIAKENDESRRTILLLLLGVLEANIAGIDRLSKKIDELRTDEQGLRASVLNGHAEAHEQHHDYIAEQIKYRDQAAEERRWVRDRMASDCAGVCEWSRKQMLAAREAEKTAIETAKADKRVARDTVIRLIVTAVVSALMGMGGAMWVLR